MNPDTGQFTELVSSVEEQIAENKGWIRFSRGEIVHVKGHPFRVVDIGERHLVLKAQGKSLADTQDLVCDDDD